MAKRLARNTIAFWVKHFGFTIEWWDVGTNKWTGSPGVEIVCYTDGDLDQHSFYF